MRPHPELQPPAPNGGRRSHPACGTEAPATPTRLQYDRAASGRGPVVLLLLAAVLLVLGFVEVTRPSLRVWALVLGLLPCLALASSTRSHWVAFPAGIDGRGLLVLHVVGVPVMCVTLWEGSPVRLEERLTTAGCDIALRVVLGRWRSAALPLVAVDRGTTTQMRPRSLRALAAAVHEPPVPGGPRLAAVLHEQAVHVEAGGSVDDSPVVRAVADAGCAPRLREAG